MSGAYCTGGDINSFESSEGKGGAVHSFFCYVTYSSTIHSFVHTFTCSLVHMFTCSLVHSFTRLHGHTVTYNEGATKRGTRGDVLERLVERGAWDEVNVQ